MYNTWRTPFNNIRHRTSDRFDVTSHRIYNIRVGRACEFNFRSREYRDGLTSRRVVVMFIYRVYLPNFSYKSVEKTYAAPLYSSLTPVFGAHVTQWLRHVTEPCHCQVTPPPLSTSFVSPCPVVGSTTSSTSSIISPSAVSSIESIRTDASSLPATELRTQYGVTSSESTEYLHSSICGHRRPLKDL